jgi:hypothetical protein
MGVPPRNRLKSFFGVDTNRAIPVDGVLSTAACFFGVKPIPWPMRSTPGGKTRHEATVAVLYAGETEVVRSDQVDRLRAVAGVRAPLSLSSQGSLALATAYRSRGVPKRLKSSDGAGDRITECRSRQSKSSPRFKPGRRVPIGCSRLSRDAPEELVGPARQRPGSSHDSGPAASKVRSIWLDG